jgi:hypothetical protein
MIDSDTLVIVPTKGRPHLIQPQYEAIYATVSEPVDIVYVICESDWPNYQEVTDAIPENVLVVGDDATYPSKLNAAAEAFADQYKYLVLFNDEHRPETVGWDARFKEALGDESYGIAYGYDGIWPEGTIPSAPMLPASMYAKLGWVALPGLHHILVDNVWLELARAVGTIHFFPDVHVIHHHRNIGAQDDATYRETNDNQAHQDEDSATYYEWMRGDGFRDAVEKLS